MELSHTWRVQDARELLVELYVASGDVLGSESEGALFVTQILAVIDEDITDQNC